MDVALLLCGQTGRPVAEYWQTGKSLPVYWFIDATDSIYVTFTG